MEKKALISWLNELSEYNTPDWEEMPELDLYMDQVVTYIHQNLSLLDFADEKKLITPSMINNYVKQKVIEKPQGKQYSKDQISILFIIALLKKVVAIGDIDTLSKIGNFPSEYKHEKFRELQISNFDEIAKTAISKIEKSDLDEPALLKLIIDYTIRARVNMLVSEKLIEMIKEKK